MEQFFFVAVILGFLMEVPSNDVSYPLKTVSKTSERYLKQNFIYDLLPLIPYRFIFKFKFSRFFYFVKIMRIRNFLRALDTSSFMKHVKKYFHHK